MVVVGIVGPQRSGKKSVAAALQKLRAFRVLTLDTFHSEIKETHQVADKETEDEAESSRSPPAAANGASPATGRKGRLQAADAALDFCMSHWRDDFLVLGFRTLEEVQLFRKRPLFLLLAVDAPIVKRLQRAATEDVSSFLSREDRLMFGSDAEEAGRGIYACMKQADATILSDGGLDTLEEKLRTLDIVNPERRRPSWDTYFMRLASLAASRANCLKRRVGAVVVRSNRLVSTGYNGTHSAAINCLDGGCERCSDPSVGAGRQLEACSCIHAETNALLEAGRERCLGGTLYITCLPCLGCAKLTIQAGIKRVVYGESYDAQSGSLKLFTNAGLEVYRFADRYPCIPHAIVSYAD